MRALLGSLVVIPLAIVAACDDDSSRPSTADAGTDATASTPYVPQPLACSAAGTFDPCGAPVDPTVFAAVSITDGGVSDAMAADAGPAPTGCVASGAMRVACIEPQTHFDLAAGEDGASLLVAYAQNASRFDIARDGTLSAPTALQSSSEIRIVSGAGGTAVISASGRNASFTRDGNKTGGYLSFQSELDRTPAIGGAGVMDDGHILALFRGGGDNAFWSIPTDYGGLHNSTTPQKDASVLYVGASGFVTAGGKKSALSINGVVAPGTYTTVFAAGPSPIVGHALAASIADDVIDVYASRKEYDPDFVRMRIVREPPCSENGCGYVCTETRRIPVPTPGSFVQLANGNVYFVYGEVNVTRQRQTTTDSNIGCDIFGGCGCSSSFEYKSVGDIDAVVMQVVAEPYQLVERTRVRLALSNAATNLLDGNPENGLEAVARGNQIHVLLRGSGSEMARVVLDLSIR